MDEKTLRQEVVDTGIDLLEEGLVARTWGNVSRRTDVTHFLITPSGRDYKNTKPEELALYDIQNKTYEGPLKPSSEKGIHAAAYEIFPEAGMVIHTHQTYASAFGVVGFDRLKMTEEERKSLGGIGEASYGLPGTGKLKKAVRKCFENGCHTVLMKHHGAVVVGEDREDAMKKILLLEEICKRNYKGHNTEEKAAVAFSRLGIPLKAQLDDMAQMIGRKIPVVEGEPEKALLKCPAVIVPNKGIYVKGKDSGDTEALKILVEKAAVTALHSRECKEVKTLGFLDCLLMYEVYQRKYSKKK
ncbi:MAG: class II aldolase/adducin family protein [Lachnospiraceae bacterium]|nr:class II aldolase/adducin family protein [Lachnospiraceae bacterium]